MSDWFFCLRYWFSVIDVERILLFGCYFVVKLVLSDKNKMSWRFLFFFVEVEFFKFVLDIVRKCFLVLKIILKDYF